MVSSQDLNPRPVNRKSVAYTINTTASPLSVCLSSFFRQLPFELNKRNSTKTCHMFRSECDLKMRDQTLGVFFPPKNRGPITIFSSSQLSSNFNGEYLLNEMRYRQSGTSVGSNKVSPTAPQNFVNFSPQTA